MMELNGTTFERPATVSKADITDFAPSAMIRLIAAGLAKQGIHKSFSTPSGAHISYRQKRSILEDVLAKHGPDTILTIADSAKELPPEPVAQALVRARNMDDFFERWRRLERFSHFRHIVDVTRIETSVYQLSHVAKDAGPLPIQAESLLVFGLITVLAEIIGCRQVRLETETGETLRENGQWLSIADLGNVGSVLLTAAPGPEKDSFSALSFKNDLPNGIRQLILADPVRRWQISDLAQETGISTRTLQRRLTEQSMPFSRILKDARLEVAASYLSETKGPSLAEIGFLSGFSDQAHFTRIFNDAVGTTPNNYRSEFGR